MNRLLLRHGALCTEIRETLEAYLADELDPRTHAIVAAHVAFCQRCQNEIGLIQAIDKVFREMPRQDPPPQIFDAIVVYVRAHPDKGETGLHGMFESFMFYFSLQYKEDNREVLSWHARPDTQVC